MLNLSDMFVGANFALDDRSIERKLEDFKRNVALIPFEKGSELHWDKVFFPNGDDDIRYLAFLFRKPELGGGDLPPQQAFLLAFLRQLETPKALLNTLPAAHRQLYYRELLGLQPRSAKPDQVALSFTLNPEAPEQLLPEATLLDGGQDSQGKPLQYQLDQPLQANQGRLSDVRWCRFDQGQHYSCVLQDDAATPWSELDVRLFEANEREQKVATGRVVAAEVLALATGVRKIELTFKTAVAKGAVALAVSGQQGWVELQTQTLTDPAMSIVLSLGADAPAITASNGLDGFHDPVPLLKLSRLDGQPIPEVSDITVSVSQPSDIAFSTQDGTSLPGQVCMPFGAEPLVGASIRLMAADWCRKSQSIDITLAPHWEGLPAKGFKDWYKGYEKAPENEAFMVQAQCYGANGWENLGEAQALFAKGKESLPVRSDVSFSFTDLPADVIDSADPSDWGSQLRLVLGPQTFLHQEYWRRISTGTASELNPPYTPQWQRLDIRYSSKQTQDLRQYLLTPFGHEFDSDKATTLEKPQLYLGFSELRPGQSLSLYWKMQSPQRLNLNWQYLSQDNQWKSLNADVLDATDGWFGSGLWAATLPADAGKRSPWMPTGQHWLRVVAALPEGAVNAAEHAPSHYPRLEGVLVNAMTATLADAGQVPIDHFDQPLPVASIFQAAEAIPALESVVQPWPSQGGQAPESMDDFNSRAARRLSHRERALRRSDLQALLREQFPEVYAVSLPTNQDEPGTQTVTVIPVPGRRDNVDAQRPAFNPARLERMRQYLQQHTSPWANLVIRNPQYKTVDVAYQVEFVSGISPDYGYRQLNELLSRQYIPWAWDLPDAVVDGKTLDYYQMLKFIQQQSLVSKVITLTLDGAQQTVQAKPGHVLIPGMGADALPAQFTLTALGEKTLRFNWLVQMGATSYTLCQNNQPILDGFLGHEYPLALDAAWQYPAGTVFEIKAIADQVGKGARQTMSQAILRDLNTPIMPADIVAGDDYGKGLAISGAGNVIAVGAPKQSADLGAVYLFLRDGAGWRQSQKLPGRATGGGFGGELVLNHDGSRLIVAASNTAAGGSIYVLDLDSEGNWVQTQAWDRPANAGADKFGRSIALNDDGSCLAIGMSGVGGVYYVVQKNGVWSDLSKPIVAGETEDGSGSIVRLSANGQVLVVARGSNKTCSVYRMDGEEWNKDNTEHWGKSTHAYYASALAINSDGDRVVVRGGEDRSKGFVDAYHYANKVWGEKKRFYCNGYNEDYNRFGTGISPVTDTGHLVVTYDNDSQFNGFEVWGGNTTSFVAAVEMKDGRSQAKAVALDHGGHTVLVNDGRGICVY